MVTSYSHGICKIAPIFFDQRNKNKCENDKLSWIVCSNYILAKTFLANKILQNITHTIIRNFKQGCRFQPHSRKRT